MPVDPKFIGKTYPPVTYEVSKEKIKEYALATGDLNPLYINEEESKKSPYGGIIAMPQFAVVYAREILAKGLFDPELALNMPMLVHGEQEFEFFKVVKPGDKITTTSKIANIFQKQGRSGSLDFVVLESESKNQNGELVSKGKWTFVIRG